MPQRTNRIEPHSHRNVTARVIADVAEPGGDLFVIVPSFSQQRSLVVGYCMRPDEALPKRGDECLVTFDQTNNPWVVAWAS